MLKIIAVLIFTAPMLIMLINLLSFMADHNLLH